MKKTAVIISGLALITSWVAVLFFGYPVNNSLVLSGLVFMLLSTFFLLFYINSHIKQLWQKVLMYALVILVELYLVIGALLYFYWF